MKKSAKGILIMILALVVLGLSSCSMVFYSSVAGSVRDEDNNELGDIDVYLYLDKGAWEADKASYDPSRPDHFKAEKYDLKTATLANGSFAFDKIYWKTASSDFGKDADIREAWLIYHSDRYGMESQEVRVTSESRNTAAPMKMEDKTETHTYLLEFQDEKGNVINDASIHFNWSYNGKPGKDEAETGYGTNGNAVTVTYYKDAGVPELKVYDITSDRKENDKEEWAINVPEVPTKDSPLLVKGAKDAEKDKHQTTSDPIALKRNWFYMTLSGQVRGAVSKDPVSGTVKLEYGGKTWERSTESQLSNDGNMVIRESFTGLGNAAGNAEGKRLVITDPAKVKISVVIGDETKVIYDALNVNPYEDYSGKILYVEGL